MDADFEVVRAAWAKVGEGDIEGLLAHLHPDVEVVPFGAAMRGHSYHGHAGVRQWWEEEIEPSWETFETHPERFERIGGRLVVFGHWVARGRTSGVELQRPATWVIDVNDGKIARWHTYTDRDEALAAAGED